MCWYALVYVGMCWYVLLCVGMCSYVVVCVGMRWYMLVFVSLCISQKGATFSIVTYPEMPQCQANVNFKLPITLSFSRNSQQIWVVLIKQNFSQIL